MAVAATLVLAVTGDADQADSTTADGVQWGKAVLGALFLRSRSSSGGTARPATRRR